VLTIGADGVDVNLGGYSISSSGGAAQGGNYSIVDDGFDLLTVRNGTIKDTCCAISLSDANLALVVNLTTTEGIYIFRGGHNEIRHSDIVGRTPINIGESSGNVVADSTLRSEAGYGVTISKGIGDADGNRIVRNRVIGDPDCCSGVGIQVYGDSSQIRKNVVSGFTGLGIYLLGFSTGNVIADNIVTGTVASNNPFYVGDGIVLESPAILSGNTVSDNADDGIDASRVDGATVTGNTANDNGDLGIEAPPSTIDGGGNRASGNGNPLQCTNVFCQ
jgi:parallel beta-helix repeat protein